MMKAVCAIVLFFFLGKSGATIHAYDVEACYQGSRPVDFVPRPLDATVPLLFDSPGYNASDVGNSVYPPNTTCEWQISSSSAELMRLNFFSFDVEDSLSCEKDLVEIYFGADDTGDFAGKFCGTQGPIVDARADNQLFVRFVSDDTVETTGFIARAGEVLENSGVCSNQGEVITDPEGIVFSANYPENYDVDLVCRFDFEAPAGQRIELDFGAMTLAQNCNDDFIEVYDNDPRFIAGTDRVGVFYGGDQLPAVMTSRSNTAFVYFESDNTQTAPGFFIRYRHVA